MDPNTKNEAYDVSIDEATEETLEGWLVVHNVLIPNAPLTLQDARERLVRDRLLVAVKDRVVVGSTTVRPPTGDSRSVMVIVRVLPEHQGAGIGTALYGRAVHQAEEHDPSRLMTCVLESNRQGLAFAVARGFREVDRYVLDGDDTAFVDLARPL